MNRNYTKQLQHPVFKVVAKYATENNIPAYVIGGYVRDLILGRPSKDIDIVVVGDGPAFASEIAKIMRVKKVSIFQTYGTAHFSYKDLDVEFVGARKESYAAASRNPTTLAGSLQDDQNRRDFTINAMALNLFGDQFGELIDPFNGISDIENKVLKSPLDPDITFNDDPLRMMRAIRFAAQLNFRIEHNCLQAIHKNADRIKIITKERISEELNKIIVSHQPSRGFMLLRSTNLLGHIFPELLALEGIETIDGKSHKDNFLHTLEVLDNLSEFSDNLWLRWAAILHDIAKPPTKRFDKVVGWTFHGHEDLGAKMVAKIFKQLKLPLDHKMKYVQNLVRLHLRPIALIKGTVTDSAIRRLLSEAGDDIDDLMLLCNADITSKNDFKVKKYKRNFELVAEKLKLVEEKDRIRNFQPPITGDFIMKTFGLQPCMEIGTIKSLIKEAILEGKIKNNFEEAKEEMLILGKSLGLKISKL